MPSPDFALAIEGLDKGFDRPVVQNLELKVRAGEFYALLGPNGAGKTTILRMVAGLLQPDKGSIHIFGIDSRRDPLAAKRIVAWVSDEPMVYDRLTPMEYLQFVAGLWEIPAAEAEAKAKDLIGWLGLGPHANDQCGGFSKGMLQKVALAGALVHEPRLIILDEPLTGLDAGSARQVKDVLKARVASGVTVIMTTHILEVAERMAERIGVLARGNLIAEGTLAELRTRIGRETTLEEIFLDLVNEAPGARKRRRVSATTASPATALWFARHEWSLAWRDFVAMMSGGRRVRKVAIVAILIVAAMILHLIANGIVAPWVKNGIVADKETLVVITAGGFLFWTVMLSQAMESVTRAYYARSDLDLILSSPASSRKLFAVRTAAIAMTTVLLACLLASPVVDMLVVNDGPRWFAAYGVLGSLGALSAALAVVSTLGLFNLVGPKRTRLISQIVAGVVGAGFVIGIQAVAILSYGNMNRFDVIDSPEFIAAAPGLDSVVWIPARAAMGDLPALAILAIVCFGLLALVISISSRSFARHAVAAAGVSAATTRRDPSRSGFRPGSQKHALRLKEWTLLRRDPWLLSQTLMQILYLVPPALFLWISYGQTAGTYVVVIPVIVMAAGQLAGGLSWLAISGEDAHDLVVTAPVSARSVLIAKIQSVLTVIFIVFTPICVLMIFASLELAITTAVFAALSSGSATAIQLWFRIPMRRAMFRRRQVASRAATISEALSSIMWAGAGVLYAGDQWLWLLPATLAVLVMSVAWLVAPKGKRV